MCPVFNIDQTFKEGRIEGRKTFFCKIVKIFPLLFLDKNDSGTTETAFIRRCGAQSWPSKKGGTQGSSTKRGQRCTTSTRQQCWSFGNQGIFAFFKFFDKSLKKSTSIANAGMYKALSSALLIE